MFNTLSKGRILVMKINKIFMYVGIFLLIFVAHSSSAFAYNKPLSEFHTKFSGANAGRANNIKVASTSVDGAHLEPGEVFSFNETVGPTIGRRGYLPAKIFVNGEEKEGYGGGVCQVSSTIFNAAKMAGLEIVERHPHSKEVHYVGKNQDAATSYGGVDLKFKNNKNFPIKLNTYIMDESIYVQVIRA